MDSDLNNFLFYSLMVFCGLFVLRPFFYKSKNEKLALVNPVLNHKVCPYCKEINDTSNLDCQNCYRCIVFKYGENVCLNCGHTGRTKVYHSPWKQFGYSMFSSWPSFWFTDRSQRICRNCKRLMRETDYST